MAWLLFRKISENNKIAGLSFRRHSEMNGLRCHRGTTGQRNGPKQGPEDRGNGLGGAADRNRLQILKVQILSATVAV